VKHVTNKFQSTSAAYVEKVFVKIAMIWRKKYVGFAVKGRDRRIT